MCSRPFCCVCSACLCTTCHCIGQQTDKASAITGNCLHLPLPSPLQKCLPRALFLVLPSPHCSLRLRHFLKHSLNEGPCPLLSLHPPFTHFALDVFCFHLTDGHCPLELSRTGQNCESSIGLQQFTLSSESGHSVDLLAHFWPTGKKHYPGNAQVQIRLWAPQWRLLAEVTSHNKLRKLWLSESYLFSS